MKRFDNAKDLREYLKKKAKLGETVILDERTTESHPKRSHFFTKQKKKSKEKNE